MGGNNEGASGPGVGIPPNIVHAGCAGIIRVTVGMACMVGCGVELHEAIKRRKVARMASDIPWCEKLFLYGCLKLFKRCHPCNRIYEFRQRCTLLT